MKIMKQIKVKQVITEESRSLLTADFKKRFEQLEQEIQQLIFEQKKMERKHPSHRQKIISKFQKEIDDRKEKQIIVQNQIETIHNLPSESEIVEREIEALVDVEVGMDWNKIVSEQVIVVRNNKIIRIDEAGE
ncbi:YlqD family protein [Paraliobacillus salinarum]|uniref:YlqD family protein n=1 Tax=Paraliobacillus salinarum TaxID=1158996 RepID=UPI0015F47F46|nr:YlqD family protein [Paraliobacillus salinarum]